MKALQDSNPNEFENVLATLSLRPRKGAGDAAAEAANETLSGSALNPTSWLEALVSFGPPRPIDNWPGLWTRCTVVTNDMIFDKHEKHH